MVVHTITRSYGYHFFRQGLLQMECLSKIEDLNTSMEFHYGQTGSGKDASVSEWLRATPSRTLSALTISKEAEDV